MCIRQKILFLIIGAILINGDSGYAVVGAEWILKPRPLWNKIVDAGLDHKIYVYETNTSDHNKVEFGETINVNIEQLWKESLRQTLMYGYVLTYEGRLEPELEERKGERVDAQLITTHSLTKEEKQMLEAKGATEISEIQGKENSYLIILPLNESIIEILKLEFVELLQGTEKKSFWNPRMGLLLPTQQIPRAPVNNINIQMASDILPLYQVVENSDKLDHPLRTLIGYKKEKLKRLTAQRAPFLSDSLSISVKDDEIMVDIFITYTEKDKGIEKIRSIGVNAYPPVTDGTISITSARVPISLLPEIVQLSCVKSVSISSNYKLCLDRSYFNSNIWSVQTGIPPNWNGYTGKDVIIGIIDTGIDINHDDFKDENGKSRILYIWDQTDNSGSKPWGYDYGTEWTKNDIDWGRCMEKDIEGHGTHVAGIAAGDGSASGNGYLPYRYVGMAPKADIIVVKTTFVDNPDIKTGMSGADIRNALQYIESKAQDLRKKFVINMSLGTQFGAHDGTSPMEKAIDIVVRNGGQVVVATGNEGDDYIHAEEKVSTNNTKTITFKVPDYTPWTNDTDYVMFDMWYNGMDTMSVTVTSPRGAVISKTTGQPVNPEWTIDGAIQIENSPGGVDPNNYDNRCLIYLFDFDDIYGQNYPPKSGEWTITITGDNIKKDGIYDIWIANSNLGGQHASFAEKNFSRSKLVSIPGTANYAITVGAYCTKGSWTNSDGKIISYSSYPKIGDIASFSSPGPTRDGRLKPEIVAPGFVIASALSADSFVSSEEKVEDGKHCIMQGTSMSAPHVTGVIALMLQAMPNWGDEYKNNLTKLARKDNFTGTLPNNTWGYGKLNANFLGGIQGKVTENDGETPIPNAAIRVVQNGIEKETIYTSKEGVYKFLFIVAGTYDVKVDAYTCKSTERKGIKVEIGRITTDINFSLEKKDTTPPITPRISDDGTYTNNATQLHASWLSSDQESGVVEYQYAIGSTKGGVDIVNWTSTGAINNVIKTGLNLIKGITYYFSVKARNGEGLWSDIGYSDGIKIISPGSISGTVTTSTGIPLPNIVISIQNVQNTVTDKTGRYKLVNIPMGSYVVNAKIEGSDITETKKT